MDSKDFINPKLTGKRFEDHTIPLELLEDFTLYEELLLKVAKWVYYEQHQKTRVPKGFGHGVSLKLSGVEEGSSIATIMLAASSFFVRDLDTYPIFEEARDRIVKCIDAAENQKDLNGYLPPELFIYFNRMGKRLKDDEAIDFAPNSTYSSKLTKANRKRLALASPNVSLVESETSLRGVISAFDKAENKCTIITTDKTKVSAKMDKEYYDIFLDAFNKYENNCRVLISGLGQFNKQDRLESFAQVDSITILDALDVPSRLEEFLLFEDGWMDGQGTSYKKDDVRWLSDKFESNINEQILLPFTFPTIEGGIQFEWKHNEHDLTLYVLFSDKSGYLHYLNTDDDDFFEQEFNFDFDEAWQELNQILSKYFISEHGNSII